MPDAEPEQALTTSVLLALAGLRSGEVACVLAPPGRLHRAAEAATGQRVAVIGPADVVLVAAAVDILEALELLGPGGRLVAVAADEPAARRTAGRHGLVLRHVEPVAGGVAWAAHAPLRGQDHPPG